MFGCCIRSVSREKQRRAWDCFLFFLDVGRSKLVYTSGDFGYWLTLAVLFHCWCWGIISDRRGFSWRLRYSPRLYTYLHFHWSKDSHWLLGVSLNYPFPTLAAYCVPWGKHCVRTGVGGYGFPFSFFVWGTMSLTWRVLLLVL